MSIVTCVLLPPREREVSKISPYRIGFENPSERERYSISYAIGLNSGWPMGAIHCIRQVCEDHDKCPRTLEVQFGSLKALG